uniref:50S ribosomal protein L9, chloroplastic n=1 Tax=Dasya binghamiae TaxID=1896963 RepID=A0A1C8XRY7_9FLOR|nr:ribosomal protein L9 [Dasya binghamiae]AOH77258.1 ribosomal protein L9 [Dasya binghamiae]
MKQKISIVLKEDYTPIGQKNKVIRVARGYAINYLVPNNIAEIATKKKIKHLQMFELIQNKKLENNKLKANEEEKNLQLIHKISITKKVGDDYNIFGSINEKDVINKILQYTGIKLNKKQIKLINIKKIGAFYLEINLINNQSCQIKLYIIPVNI